MFFTVFIEFPTLLYNMADKLIVKSNIRNKNKYPQIFPKIFIMQELLTLPKRMSSFPDI
jgi:hypothetical protein